MKHRPRKRNKSQETAEINEEERPTAPNVSSGYTVSSRPLLTRWEIRRDAFRARMRWLLERKWFALAALVFLSLGTLAGLTPGWIQRLSPPIAQADSKASSGYLNGVEPTRSAAGFTHPGVFVDLPTLESVRQKVKNGVEPQTSILKFLNTDKDATKVKKVKPNWSLYSDRNDVVRKLKDGTLKTAIKECAVGTTAINPAGCVKQCDPNSKQGCMLSCGWSRTTNAKHDSDREKTDACKINIGSQANSAYMNALLWYYTEDPAYAEKAVETLNAYGKTFKGFVSTEDNRYVGTLLASWGAETFVRAAEIIRYTYPPAMGRTTFDTAAFSSMLENAFVPLLKDGAPRVVNNWRTSSIDGLTNIAVFLDRRDLYKTALEQWRRETRTYIYLSSDGSRALANPQRSYPSNATQDCTWINGRSKACAASPKKLPGLVYQNGQNLESCRDMWHSAAGMGGIINVAETARIQGDDLYGEERKRIMQGLSYMMQFNQQVTTQGLPKNFCADAPKHADFPKSWTSPANVLDPVSVVVAYNHYTTKEGIAFPVVTIPGYKDTYSNQNPSKSTNAVKVYVDKLAAQLKDTHRGHVTSYQVLTHYNVGKGVPPRM